MKYFYALLLCAALAAPVHAGQLAYAVRSTEIKQQPFSDAATVAALKENAGVDIVSRQGGWVRITSKSGDGWVRMLSLRSDSKAAKQGDAGLQSLLNVGRSGSSGITVATGVRGLSEEDLKHAHPDPGELAKLKNNAVSQEQAEQFALDAKLNTQRLDYLPLDGR